MFVVHSVHIMRTITHTEQTLVLGTTINIIYILIGILRFACLVVVVAVISYTGYDMGEYKNNNEHVEK